MATTKQTIGLGDIRPHPPRTNGTIYRILNFCHFVDLFQKRELHFSHPSNWDDIYETRLKHDDMDCVFGQCWSNQFSSDAMWRIYSTNFMGVRISTTPAKFAAAFKNAKRRMPGLRFRLQDVRYSTNELITLAVSDIRKSLNADDNKHEAADALFYKRHSFDHEAECRALLITGKRDEEAKKNGIKLKIDPHDFITRIMLDPRIPPQLEDTFTFFIRKNLKYEGPVSKSVLYTSPNPL